MVCSYKNCSLCNSGFGIDLNCIRRQHFNICNIFYIANLFYIVSSCIVEINDFNTLFDMRIYLYNVLKIKKCDHVRELYKESKAFVMVQHSIAQLHYYNYSYIITKLTLVSVNMGDLKLFVESFQWVSLDHCVRQYMYAFFPCVKQNQFLEESLFLIVLQ